MRAAAAADGIDLVAFSGFRDFDRQLGIWNGKFRGERPMQDRAGQPLDARDADARPSASRPSSGGRRCPAPAGITGARISTSWTRRLCQPDTSCRSCRRSISPAGPSSASRPGWIDTCTRSGSSGRYATDRGGVSPEPWHLSHAPVAARAAGGADVDGLRAVLAARADRREGGGAGGARPQLRELRRERGSRRRIRRLLSPRLS